MTKKDPYCDFAVFGPDGRQQGKLLKFQAQVWVGGELNSSQRWLKALRIFWGAWLGSWRVYSQSTLGHPPIGCP
eukprot:1008838-Amphidinium_carterae.1